MTARHLAIAAWSTSHTAEAAAALTTLLTEQQSMLLGHSGPVTALAFSPNGLQLASGGEDGSARFWDAITGQPAPQKTVGHSRTVTALAYAPNVDVLASASTDGDVRLWNIGTGETIGRPLDASANRVNAVAFSADGARIASGGGDGTLRLWDRHAGKSIGSPIRYSTAVQAVAVSLDGKWLASAAEGGTVELRDPRDGRQKFMLTNLGGEQPGNEYTDLFKGVKLTVRSLAFNRAGTKMATGDNSGGLGIWDINSRRSEWMDAGDEPVISMAYSPDGARVASTGTDQVAYLWDPNRRVAIGAPITTNNTTVWSFSFSPDGKVLATGGADGTIRLWDAATGRPASATPANSQPKPSAALAYTELCARFGPPTEAEWKQYAPEDPGPPKCQP